MQTFAQHALSGTILASALGAVVLCLVLLLYGFKTEPDDERSPAARLLLIRLGHALAAACFAAALMLSTVALIDRGHAPAPAASDEVERLTDRVETLERRLAATESRLAEVETPRVVASTARVEPRRPHVASPAPPVRKPRVQTIASERPAPAPVTTVASDDFGSQARDDWEAVKRGFRDAGRDLRAGVVDLGRRIKRTFE